MENELIRGIGKDIAPKIYEDGFQDAVKQTGGVVSLLPRAIRAALEPLEKWILIKEHNIKEVEQLLSVELQNVSPDNIVSPEPYVFVPALQALSYSIDSSELKEMYAQLLSKAMNSETKYQVSPAFVEVIKQMSPLDCRLMEAISFRGVMPTIDLVCVMEYKFSLWYSTSLYSIEDILCDIELLPPEITGPDYMANQKILASSISNLTRLGLVKKTVNKKFSTFAYEEFQTSKRYESIYSNYLDTNKNNSGTIEKTFNYYSCSEFGKAFAEICISSYSSGIIMRISQVK